MFQTVLVGGVVVVEVTDELQGRDTHINELQCPLYLCPPCSTAVGGGDRPAAGGERHIQMNSNDDSTYIPPPCSGGGGGGDSYNLWHFEIMMRQGEKCLFTGDYSVEHHQKSL